MLKVTPIVVDNLGNISPHVRIAYDWGDYWLLKLDDHAYQIVCRGLYGIPRFYSDHPYDSVADACAAIFWNSVTVERTEYGRVTYMGGEVVNVEPLGYYDVEVYDHAL